MALCGFKQALSAHGAILGSSAVPVISSSGVFSVSVGPSERPDLEI